MWWSGTEEHLHEVESMQHVVIAWMEDKPGVLNRVASLFRRRGFNIESLVVGHSETPGISRMTFVVDGDDRTMQQVESNLLKLINVIAVRDVTNEPAVVREMALIKVRADEPTVRTEIMQIADIFRAHVVDVGPASLTLEVTGEQDKIDSLVALLGRFGIAEIARTGRVAMVRGLVEAQG
jgi:acetolactate synthase-1/3 small subunit